MRVCVYVCAYDYLLTNWESFDILYKDHPHWEKNHCQHSDCDDVHCVVSLVCECVSVSTNQSVSQSFVDDCDERDDDDAFHCVSLCVVVVCMLPIIQTYLKLSTPIVNNSKSFLN